MSSSAINSVSHCILWVPTVPVPVCLCIWQRQSASLHAKSANKCGKSAEKVRIGAEKVRESAEKCESPFSHTNYGINFLTPVSFKDREQFHHLGDQDPLVVSSTRRLCQCNDCD